LRTQSVPGSAPAGLYHFNAYGVAAGDTSWDSFTFEKLGADGSDGLAGWYNTGEGFGEVMTANDANLHPSSFLLHPCSPNPFNPTTVARYELRDASYVSLRVYDTAGRLVATLVNGWRDAGSHEVTFDASDLAAGVYIARLQAGDYVGVRKLILLK
jgi:hypothetical protein